MSARFSFPGPEAADVIHGIARRESVAKGPRGKGEPPQPSFPLSIFLRCENTLRPRPRAARLTRLTARCVYTYMHAARRSPRCLISILTLPIPPPYPTVTSSSSSTSSCHTLSRSHRVDKLQRSERWSGLQYACIRVSRVPRD